MTVTSSQMRAGRALLAWSQHDLAREAKVGSSTVADFERGQRTPISNNIEAMRSALERGGVRFVGSGAVLDEGETLALEASQSLQPIRWIDATDIDQWADRRDGQSALPELIGRLLIATVGEAVAIRFPAGDSVQFSGWDGVCEAPVDRQPVPSGRSVWELGTTKTGIPAKAQADYEKRSGKPGAVDPAASVFVFVTPRRWPGKDKWAAARRKERIWKDVKALDVDDLVHWLDQCPPAAFWLAIRIGKRPNGLLGLNEFWNEWIHATRPALNRDIVLAGRDEEAAKVVKWLRAPPELLAIEADAVDEAFAFLFAAINELPTGYAEAQLPRAFIPSSEAEARHIAESMTRLIICLRSADPGFARSLIGKGHHVFVATVGNASGTGSVTKLRRPDRYDLEKVLASLLAPSEGSVAETAQLSVQKLDAGKLAADSARSLTVLRRLISAGPQRTPAWAAAPVPKPLVAALLVGGWSEGSTADKQVLERLCGLSYADASRQLAAYLAMPDGPLRRSEDAWRIASPRDAFALLAPHLTQDEFRLFLDAFVDVLVSPDPRFQLDAEGRQNAGWKRIGPAHSALLRRGLTETAILFSVFHERAMLIQSPASQIDYAVSRVLKDADAERWWSLHSDFQRIAEASPASFLGAIEDALQKMPSPLADLFKESDNAFMGEQYLSNLLWGLERLAWSKQYFALVADILLQLSNMDPGGKWSNRPSGTLRKLFLLWSPETSLPLTERLEVIDVLRERYGVQSWKFLLSLSPKPHDTSTPADEPQWRDFSTEKETITYPLLAKGNRAIAERLLNDVGDDPARWCDLLNVHTEHPTEERAEFRKKLIEAVPSLTDEKGRQELRSELRRLLHRHRQFADANWSLPASELAEIEHAMRLLEPADTIAQVAWMFGRNPSLPDPPLALKYEEKEALLLSKQVDAVSRIYGDLGIAGVVDLASKSEAPGLVGRALAKVGLLQEEEFSLVETFLSPQASADSSLAHGFIVTKSDDVAWCHALLDRVTTNSIGPEAQVRVLLAMPSTRTTWDLADGAGEAVSSEYWRRVNPWFQGTNADAAYLAQKLLEWDRPRAAISYLGSRTENTFESELILRALAKGVSPKAGQDDEFTNDDGMFAWYVGNLFGILDKDSSVDRMSIAHLEWVFFRLLERSERPPNILYNLIASDEAFFLQLLKLIYKRSDGAEDENSSLGDEKLVTHAWHVLDEWHVIPGTKADGTIDSAEHSRWIKAARDLCRDADRIDVADYRIGQVLAAVRPTADAEWPPLPVRETIESCKSRKLDRGYNNGLYNGRGVTTRGMTDGGAQERELAALYRKHAEKCAVRWPRTARVLEELAATYDEHAKQHDEDVVRRQW